MSGYVIERNMPGAGALPTAELHAILRKAGFNRFRHATETPFNLVLEARP